MTRWISWSEVRLGLRLIAKQPILSITIVLALSTGMGLATIGFTLRDALANGVLPFQGGDRFVRLNLYSESQGRSSLDLDRYHQLVNRSSSFEHVGAVGGGEFNLLRESGELSPIRCALITPRSFRFLPAAPIAGRLLIPADGETGAEPVALIRDSLWRRLYDADPSIVGRQIDVAGARRTVVGILPDAFEFPAAGEVWLPLDEAQLGGRDGQPADRVRIFAVLRADASVDSANAELEALASADTSGSPGGTEEARVRAMPYTGESDAAGTVMSAFVGVLVLVLLVVAANVATLVFARTWSRAPELAVRSALGADRSRVVGQLFVEVLLLGIVSAGLGLAGAQLLLSYMHRTISEIPFWVTFEPSPRTMAFVVMLTLVVSVVSGLLPALRVTRRDLNGALQSGGRGFAAGGFGRLGGAMLVAEIALSVALLNGAVVMARTFASHVGLSVTLAGGHVLTAKINGENLPEERGRLMQAIGEVQGVVAAGAGSILPSLETTLTPVVVEAEGAAPARAPESVASVRASVGFIEALGGHALAGRLLDANDFLPDAAPVAVVNEPFVAQFYNGRSPIGGRMRVVEARDARATGGVEPDATWMEIVGVVPDLGLGPGDPTRAAGFYIPLDADATYFSLAIKTTANPQALAVPLRKAIAGVDPTIDFRDVRPLEEVGWEERQFLSGVASAMTALGGMALLLSMVSIYALLSFMVTRRTREIGIRVALGATNRQVLRTVVGSALAYLSLGSVCGAALGLVLMEMRSVILIRMPDSNIWTIAAIALVLAGAGLGACWLPARRALGIRPAEALNTN
jgi:putative ABC transport system permease protein